MELPTLNDRTGMERVDLLRTGLDNMIWPVLLLISLIIAVLVPQTFTNLRSFVFILHSSVGLGFLVLAESICLVSGHFDLSVGSVAGFSAMATALLVSSSRLAITSNPLVAILLVVGIGVAIGLANGLMVSKVNVNPFLQTLAFLIIFRGATVVLSQSTVAGLPESYTMLGSNSTIAVALLFVAFLTFAVILRYTYFGQAVYALGSDEHSAREVGVETDRMVIAVYAISGLLSGIAGLMFTGYTGVVAPQLGEGMVFPAFAASVIGGISLYGGRGKATGALGGVILLGIIQSALTLSGVPPQDVEVVNGLVLLFAILLYNSRERIRNRILSSQT